MTSGSAIISLTIVTPDPVIARYPAPVLWL